MQQLRKLSRPCLSLRNEEHDPGIMSYQLYICLILTYTNNVFQFIRRFFFLVVWIYSYLGDSSFRVNKIGINYFYSIHVR